MLLQNMTEEEKQDFFTAESNNDLAVAKESERVANEGIPLIFDYSYTQIMTSVEIGSLHSQISNSVGFLRKQIPQYFSLACSNVPEHLAEKLSKRGSKKWFLQVFTSDIPDLPFVKDKEIVYLSPEAEDPILDINKNCVYVIGGLVDRTIQSSQSLKRGVDLGVRVARLPIKEHGNSIIKPERRVFNIDTVVSFLHHLAAGKTCEESFMLSIPKRWTISN